MPEGGQGDHDLLRLWLEGSRAFLDAKADAAKLWPQCEHLFKTWMRFGEGLAGAAGAAEADGARNPFDPAGWMRPEGQGGMADLWRWLEGPDFAGAFDEYRRALRESREWMAFSTALDEFRAVTAAGWMRAFKAYVEALSRRLDQISEAGEGDLGWDEMRALWREIADVELAAMQRSEPYLAAQRDLIRTQIDLRQALRARVEDVSGALGLPTRAEIDDLHQTMHELRAEIAELRRAGRRADGGT